jgi:hypothetical protein
MFSASLDVVTGRFTSHAAAIPQVDTTGMPDKEKARVPPLNRLGSPPTAAEAKLLALMAGGPDVVNSPEYAAAVRAVEAERGATS